MLRNQPGIHSIKVALLAERGVVEYDPKSWNPEKLINVSLPSPYFLFLLLHSLSTAAAPWAVTRRSISSLCPFIAVLLSDGGQTPVRAQLSIHSPFLVIPKVMPLIQPVLSHVIFQESIRPAARIHP